MMSDERIEWGEVPLGRYRQQELLRLVNQYALLSPPHHHLTSTTAISATTTVQSRSLQGDDVTTDLSSTSFAVVKHSSPGNLKVQKIGDDGAEGEGDPEDEEPTSTAAAAAPPTLSSSSSSCNLPAAAAVASEAVEEEKEKSPSALSSSSHQLLPPLLAAHPTTQKSVALPPSSSTMAMPGRPPAATDLLRVRAPLPERKSSTSSSSQSSNNNVVVVIRQPAPISKTTKETTKRNHQTIITRNVAESGHGGDALIDEDDEDEETYAQRLFGASRRLREARKFSENPQTSLEPAWLLQAVHDHRAPTRFLQPLAKQVDRERQERQQVLQSWWQHSIQNIGERISKMMPLCRGSGSAGSASENAAGNEEADQDDADQDDPDHHHGTAFVEGGDFEKRNEAADVTYPQVCPDTIYEPQTTETTLRKEETIQKTTAPVLPPPLALLSPSATYSASKRAEFLRLMRGYPGLR